MKSGSKEIHKAIERLVPLTWPKKSWMRDVAKELGTTYTKAENLYYRPGHSIPNTVYVKLTSLSNARLVPETIITKNYQDLDDLKEFKKQIRKEILNELVGTFQKLVESDAR